MIAFRLFDLTSDNSSRIDFSLGQLTDESYYTMNAKNMALFGHERLDGFNNMLLSPALHYIHELNFGLFGVGTEHARLVSVTFGLLTLLVLFGSLIEATNLKTAIFGTTLLGLEHVFLLFNRQALMDTPSCLPAMLALYLFVRGFKAQNPAPWLVGCGLAAAVAVTTRNQQAGLILAPFLSLAYLGRPKRHHLFVALGLFGGLAVYALVWFLPNRAEIMHMNTYYRLEQWGPKSLKEVVKNVAKALIRPEGEFGYFARHSLITLIGAAFGLVFTARSRRGVSPSSPEVAASTFAAVAMLSIALSFALISYSPGRYLMIMLPQMVVLAAIGYSNCQNLSHSRSVRWAVLGFSTLIVYHLITVLLDEAKVPTYEHQKTIFKVVLRAFVSLALVALLQSKFSAPPRWLTVRTATIAFLSLQILFLGDWWLHRSHRQFELGQWAAQNLPADAVVINGVYLGLESHAHSLTILPRLCNDDHPLQKFRDKPLFLVVAHDHPEGAPTVILGDPVPPTELIRSTVMMGYTIDLYSIVRKGSPTLEPDARATALRSEPR